jgi:hypothetical protein
MRVLLIKIQIAITVYGQGRWRVDFIKVKGFFWQNFAKHT